MTFKALLITREENAPVAATITDLDHSDWADELLKGEIDR